MGFDEAHDRAVYAWSGANNIDLHPDPVVQDVAYDSFDAGWDAAVQALANKEPR